jgi:hypothetical protein
MPYNPTIPEAGTEIDAVQMRGQLNGLKDLIDALQSIAAAVVDAVNTLPPGDPAAVGVTLDGDTLRFTFDLPQGQPGADGPTGPTGGNGTDGMNGSDGAQGPPGEVTNADLSTAYNNLLANSSNQSNGVSTLDNSYADPDVEELRQKVNELINALRR